MRTLLPFLLLWSFGVFALETGETAPDFSLSGLNKKISLSDYRGKIVVLEWLNHGCPFVRKHYDSGNMQRLQKNFKDQGVIWLSIVSSAPGKQGFVDQNGAMKDKKENNSEATDILLDPTGKVGKLYGAKTTPHMFIINQEGSLVYQGAIDDKPDADQNSIPSARNFVKEALSAMASGKKVKVNSTRAYGCSIKFK